MVIWKVHPDFINIQQALNFLKQVWKHIVDWAASCSGPAISALKHVLGKASRLQEFWGGERLYRCDSGATWLDDYLTKKKTDHT